MTDRQQSIVNYLHTRQAKSLPPPTIREIGEECDISSTSVVSYNLQALHKQGLITWHRFTARGIMLNGASVAELSAENIKLARRLEVANMRIKALREQVEALQRVRV